MPRTKRSTIDPQLASAHHALAMNLQQLGRLQDALRVAPQAVELDPNYTEGLNDISFGLVTAGLCDEALKHSKRALELRPEQTDGLLPRRRGALLPGR